MTRVDAAGPARASRSLAKSAATRRRVIEAAGQVLYRQGYAGTRLSDIAEQAGLQAGSLYYYFESKEQLVEEVLRYGEQFTHTRVRVVVKQLPQTATAGERLSAAIGGFVEAILELGLMSAAYSQSFQQLPADSQARLRPITRAFGRYWEELIRAALESGEIRCDLSAELLQYYIVRTVEQVPGWPPHVRQRVPDLAAAVRSLVFSGVGPEAAAPNGTAKPGRRARL